ncbi:XisI protein [Lusitaniella coriacea LEGE 07157]|uniref:XisI protein n=1 Tax=Lusitaniella coriacea LEGE 07157 TaxID=945747 RepID=A0A8J7J5W4_9CYAN|nr:XisI protein [Lusitaniella coriacea]MBE9118294.1 XisI protein [Lusitaniella coriacea LEGE 07157]
MENLNYQEAIETILSSFSEMVTREGEEVEIICDRAQGHYLVMVVGWHEQMRVYGSLVHLDLKDRKIWIQQDKTEPGIAKELVELGIPKSDIVLAFKSTFLRNFTEYAVG